jgi:hypothetical protein
MFEDQVFFAKVHLAAASYVDDRVWARYRQHDRSCTARSAGSDAEFRARKRFLDWLSVYVREQGNTGIATKWPLLRARLDCYGLRARSVLWRWIGAKVGA